MNFLNNDNLSPLEKRNRAAVILLAYLVFFIFLFAMIYGNKNDPKETINKEKENISVIDRINSFTKNKNYDFELSIGKNYNLYYTVGGKKISGKKTLDNKTFEFSILDNRYYYLLENNKYKKIKYIDLYEGYDDVFTNLDNVKTLLKTVNKTTIKRNNNIITESFYLKLDDYLKIYNKIYNTNYKDETDTRIENTIEYSNNYILTNLDMSELYKLVYNKNNEIVYKIKLSKIEK